MTSAFRHLVIVPFALMLVVCLASCQRAVQQAVLLLPHLAPVGHLARSASSLRSWRNSSDYGTGGNEP